MDNLPQVIDTLAQQTTERLLIFTVIFVILFGLPLIGLILRFIFAQRKQELVIRQHQQAAIQQAEERQDAERASMMQAWREISLQNFTLIGDKFNSGLAVLTTSDQKIVATLEVLVDESRKERQTHLDRLNRIEEVIQEHVSSADIRLRSELHKHNQQAMGRYEALSKEVANMETSIQGIKHLLEAHGDCDKGLVDKLNESLKLASEMVKTMINHDPSPSPPSPKPPLAIVDAPEKKRDDEDDDSEDGVEQAA